MNKFFFLIFVFLLTKSFFCYSQKTVIKGIVITSAGTPISGAMINEKGTKFATFSKTNGTFKFSVINRNAVIIITKTGFQDLVEPINNRDSFSVVMFSKDKKNTSKKTKTIPQVEVITKESTPSKTPLNQEIIQVKSNDSKVISISPEKDENKKEEKNPVITSKKDENKDSKIKKDFNDKPKKEISPKIEKESKLPVAEKESKNKRPEINYFNRALNQYESTVFNDHGKEEVHRFAGDYFIKHPELLVKSPNNPVSSNFSVSIKGSESQFSEQPLYIVDGIVMNSGINKPSFFYENDPLISLNPKDIERVEILKDISETSVYGIRGANGVIRIQTKKGKNETGKFQYHGQTGIFIPENRLKLLEPGQYTDIINESLMSVNGIPITFQSASQAVNWQNEALNVSFFTDHTFSISRKRDLSNLYLSGNIGYSNGSYSESSSNVSKLLFNFENKPTSWLDLNLNFNYTEESKNTPFFHDNRFESNPWIYASLYPPVSKSEFEEIPDLNSRYGTITPAGLWSFQNSENLISNLSGNMGFTLYMGKKLLLKSNATGNYNDYAQSYNMYMLQNNNSLNNNIFNKDQVGNIYNWNLNSQFQLTIKGKSLDWFLYAGAEINTIKSFSKSSYSVRIPLKPETGFSVSGNNTRNSKALFSGININLKNRFEISGNYRYDWFIGQNGIYTDFKSPSFKLGWWLVNARGQYSVLSLLKWEAGWGIAGAENFHFLNYTQTENFVQETNSLNNASALREVNERAILPDSKPETVEEFTFGIVSKWFDSKVTFGVEYFDRLRNNIAFLNKPEISANELFKWYNSARIFHRGFEYSLKYKESKPESGFWSEIYVQNYKAKILDLGKDFPDVQSIGYLPFRGYTPVTVFKPKSDPGAFYGYVKEGIFKTATEVSQYNGMDGSPDTWYQNQNTSAGDIRFKDLDNNGRIDEMDMTSIGSPLPDFSFAFAMGINRKKFDYSIFISGYKGNEILNLSRIWMNSTGGWGNRSAEMFNRWSEENLNGTIQRVAMEDPNSNNRVHSGMVEDGSYIRIGEVNVGYKIPLRMENKVRIYISAQNLLTLTRYSGNNPVLENPVGIFSAQGIDFGNYAGFKTVMAGVMFEF